MDPITMDEVNQHTTAELDTLREKLGETTDTGGTEKMGTLFAKLNALINVIAPSSGHEEFTTPGTHTFTVPGNVKSLNITVIGAGGGGGRGGNTGITKSTQTVSHCSGASWEEDIYLAQYGYRGTAGGNGSTVTKTIKVTPGTTLTLVVGAGGNTASAGGASSITNYATASGGSAGANGGTKSGTGWRSSIGSAVSLLSYAGLSNGRTGGNSAVGGGGYGGAGGDTYYLDSKTLGMRYGENGGKGRDGKIIIEW